MLVSAHRVLLALVGACAVAVVCAAMGAGASILVLTAASGLALAAPLLRLLLAPRR